MFLRHPAFKKSEPRLITFILKSLTTPSLVIESWLRAPPYLSHSNWKQVVEDISFWFTQPSPKNPENSTAKMPYRFLRFVPLFVLLPLP